MKASNEPWPILGFRNREGKWEEGPFDPNNLEHIAMMMELTCDCPQCREWLETVLPGARQRHRARRRREAEHDNRERNRRRRWRQQMLGKPKR